jgi:hypothetical protein
MPIGNHGCLVELPSLTCPAALNVPTGRFRLFVAADTTGSTTEALSEFALAALKQGMVYFCAWGPGCGRFHDIVDEVILEDDLGERLFVGPNESDTIMTTWHEKDTLDEAFDFFLSKWACPTEGFIPDSDYRVAMAVNNPAWAATMRQRLERVDPSSGNS